MTRATLIQAREGDRVAMNQVIKDYDPFIIYIANQRVVSGGYFDDYIQAGRMGLLTAIKKVSDNSKYLFSTFASRYIRHEMALLTCKIRGLKLHEYMLLTKYYKKSREIQQKDMCEVDMMDVLDVLKLHPFQVDIIKSHVHNQMVSMDIDELVSRKIDREIEENDLERLEDGRKRMLSEMIARLTERQADIIRMTYTDGLTTFQVADELKVSRGYVGKELFKVRRKLLDDWPNQLFLIAFDSAHFYDPTHIFHMEKWKPMQDIKYLVSNYGRVLTYHRSYNKFLIRKPSLESGRYRYHLVDGDKMLQISAHKLIPLYFETNELPTFYERS